MSKHELKLYITGETPKSKRTIKNLHHLFKTLLKEQYHLTIIDVLEDPKSAENEKVLATPLVIKELPLPKRRVIGDLSNVEQVLIGLDLDHLVSDINKEE